MGDSRHPQAGWSYRTEACGQLVKKGGKEREGEGMGKVGGGRKGERERERERMKAIPPQDNQ